MDVILLERIEKLGQMGDVVKVKNGFARNYLLPQRKALRATDANRKRFEAERAQLEADNLKRREEAASVAKKLEGLAVTLIRQASSSDQLYGSVSARDIAGAVSDAGFTIDGKQVAMNRVIKTLGLHEVHIRLHPEVTSLIRVNIARTQDEADLQMQAGTSEAAIEAEKYFEQTPEEFTAPAEETGEEGGETVDAEEK